MRVEGRRYRDEWLPNFYPSRRVGDMYVRLSRSGRCQTLTAEQDAQLNEVYMDDALYQRLEETSHIITPRNSAKVFEDLKLWQQKTYDGPHLHIVVTTKRCNLNCTYCHMNPEPVGASKSQFDLQPEVARAIARFAMESPNPILNFEFQGGEPFLNFAGMTYFIDEVRRLNASVGKTVRFSAVSNLMVVTDEQLAYCRDNGVSISYTLNGPQMIHDHFRVTRSGAGSFNTVINRLRDIQAKFPGLLSTSPLCVVSADNAKDLRQMLDFYHEAGFYGVAILKLKNLGNAARGGLGFDMREYLKYYLDALDYLYEKNRPLQQVYAERSLRVVLCKIMCDMDLGFVDWRNPIGDVSGALTYDYDGEILPSDEARSLRHEFSIGNVMNLTYDQMIRRKETFRTMNLSLRDRDSECRECAYNPFCGIPPVLEYGKTGDAVPKPHQSEDCLFVQAVLDWTFKKLQEDPLPLMRMVPFMDRYVKLLTEENDMLRPEGAQAYEEVYA